MKNIILISLLWSGKITSQLMNTAPVPLDNIGQGTRISHKIKSDSLNVDYLNVNTINGSMVSTKIKANVNAGVPVQLDNIKVQVPTTNQLRGFEIGTVAGSMTAAINAQSNYSTGAWFATQQPAQALTTTFVHGSGFGLSDAGDYILITVRNNSNADIYKIEIWLGIAYNNNIIIIEKN